MVINTQVLYRIVLPDREHQRLNSWNIFFYATIIIQIYVPFTSHPGDNFEMMIGMCTTWKGRQTSGTTTVNRLCQIPQRSRYMWTSRPSKCPFITFTIRLALVNLCNMNRNFPSHFLRTVKRDSATSTNVIVAHRRAYKNADTKLTYFKVYS